MLQREVKPSFAKISTVPSVSCQGGILCGRVLLCAGGICSCKPGADLEASAHRTFTPLAFPILLALCTAEALPPREQWQTKAFDL